MGRLRRCDQCQPGARLIATPLPRPPDGSHRPGAFSCRGEYAGAATRPTALPRPVGSWRAGTPEPPSRHHLWPPAPAGAPAASLLTRTSYPGELVEQGRTDSRSSTCPGGAPPGRPARWARSGRRGRYVNRGDEVFAHGPDLSGQDPTGPVWLRRPESPWSRAQGRSVHRGAHKGRCKRSPLVHI